jgi:hypothetical protein
MIPEEILSTEDIFHINGGEPVLSLAYLWAAQDIKYQLVDPDTTDTHTKEQLGVMSLRGVILIFTE